MRMMAYGHELNLADISCLTAPWTERYGMRRPPVDVGALLYASYMASSTYQMAVEPWLNSGWQDVTLHVDGIVSSPLNDTEGTNARALMQQRLEQIRLSAMRSTISPYNAVEQLGSAIRQRRLPDTCKGMVLCHPAEGGRYLVAISFMGTTPRLFDWMSNFRMSSEDGWHQGFLQMARQFEGFEEEIQFPKTAEAIGVDRLTLRDILEDARQADSRFRVVLVGHSQGGAVLQIYMDRKLRLTGVCPENISGYGFASPSVAKGTTVERPERYPIWHVINSDDLVPRMGSMVRLGVDLLYPADESLRRACYDWPRDAVSVRNRMCVRPMMALMRNTPSCIDVGTALLTVMLQESDQQTIPLFRLLRPQWQLPEIWKKRDARLLHRMTRLLISRALEARKSVCDEAQDIVREQRIVQQIVKLRASLGLMSMMTAMAQLGLQPHSIDWGRGPYCRIAVQGEEHMIPTVWEAGPRPRLRRLDDPPAAVFAMDSAGPESESSGVMQRTESKEEDGNDETS